MPGREAPDHGSRGPSGDLFDNLPTPAPQVPTADNTPPPPGSRRARREAATARTPVAPSQPSVTPEASEADAPPSRATPTRATPVQASPVAADQHVDQSVPASVQVDERPGDAPSQGTLDELFQPDDDDGDRGHPRARKKRRTGCLVALIIVLALVGGIAAAGVWVWNTYGTQIGDVLGWGEPDDFEPGMATGEALVTIREGDTGQPVSTALYEAGVTKTDQVFYDYLIEENIAVTFYPGVYQLQQKMTAAAALEALRNPENKLENTVGIAEGGTVDSSLPVITESIGIPLEELEAAVADPSVYGVDAPSLEGWLFPAVYTFDPEATATDVIQRMVDRTRESLTGAGVQAGDEQRVLTIASIIQREGRTEDFGKVSRVIQNRLDDGMLLQMDSTAQYGYGELHAGVVSTSEEAQYDDNPWNTYVHEGLPVGPISNPGDAAISAAMNPEDGPWFYFVTINPQSGETVFTTTYEEHEAAVERWRDWCRENPDQGC